MRYLEKKEVKVNAVQLKLKHSNEGILKEGRYKDAFYRLVDLVQNQSLHERLPLVSCRQQTQLVGR